MRTHNPGRQPRPRGGDDTWGIRMDAGQCNNVRLTIAVMLLAVIVFLLGAGLYTEAQDRKQRAAIVGQVLRSRDEVEKQRVAAFNEYSTDLKSSDTKSVFHQIYEANNAQLKLLNVMVQESQLLMTLVAASKR